MDRSLFVLGLFILSLSTFVYAEEETGFDSIVKELKSSLKDPVPEAKPRYDDSMRVVAGAAFVGSYVSANAGSAMLSGFDLHLGIELFSPEWLAEMSLRSLGNGRAEKGITIGLDEYDLKVVHQNEWRRTINLRVGGGLAAQYLKTSVNGEVTNNTSPSLLAVVGVDKVFSPKVSLGPDVSFRLPLVRDSGEKGSLDASLRLNFYF